jgi:hypothetical protein
MPSVFSSAGKCAQEGDRVFIFLEYLDERGSHDCAGHMLANVRNISSRPNTESGADGNR